MKTSLLEVILPGLMQVDCQQFLSGVDQFSSDRRGADFPRGVHYCATKELTQGRIFIFLMGGVRKSLGGGCNCLLQHGVWAW